MKEIFAAASSGAYKLGAVAAVVHLVISWWIIISVLVSDRDAQWQLIWIFLLPFDLPFSLLVIFAGSQTFLLPMIIHGIVGPLQYFLLPVLIDGFLTRRSLRSVA